jgi:hypothetical protein
MTFTHKKTDGKVLSFRSFSFRLSNYKFFFKISNVKGVTTEVTVVSFLELCGRGEGGVPLFIGGAVGKCK